MSRFDNSEAELSDLEPVKLHGNIFKRLRCYLDWHSWTCIELYDDGASMYARCKRCGYKGMIDSQGNLF
jgi:hypothetical protein